MKRIILSLSILLFLAQNMFAETDREWKIKIEKMPNKIWKEYYKCRQAVENHKKTSNPAICKKVLQLINNSSKSHFLSEHKDDILLKIGFLYSNSEKNYIKAYEYYMKAAKLGNTDAQYNLDILCKEHSWVCK